MIDAPSPRRRRSSTILLLLPAVVLALLALPHPEHAAATAPLFSDDFESGTMHAWNKDVGLVPEQQTVHAGAWAASMASGGAQGAVATAVLPGAHPELFLKAWIDLRSFSSSTTLLRMRTAAGADIVSAGVLTSGRLFTRAGSAVPTVSGTPLPKGAWHELQLHVAVGNGTGQIDVWLDGVPVTDLSSAPALGTLPIDRVQIGGAAPGRSYSAVFDDVAASPTYVDDLPPVVPSGVHATPVSGTSVELSWNPSTDVGAAGYTLYRQDGSTWKSLGFLTARRFVDTGLQPDTMYRYAIDAVDTTGAHSARSSPATAITRPSGAPPVSHVVIIDLENHSFDNVLGKLCAQVASGEIAGRQPCDGVTTAVLSNGSAFDLYPAEDVVSPVGHSVFAQQTAVDGGQMDGFDQIVGCRKVSDYACLSQYDPSQIPNLAALAERYVVSDRTFELSKSPSWVGHMVLASATQDGFQGDIPVPSTFTSQTGPGWGCDSYRDAEWWNGSAFVMVPSCVPDASGAGPYRPSPVPYVPTIFDRLDASGLSWKIYGGSGPTAGNSSGYGWAICPTFFECLGSSQKNNWTPAQDVIDDGRVGALPNFSIVAPPSAISQHNSYSMTLGDDWIGEVVGAIQSGPDWGSTAIFITYDDCGCFYDHVPPPTASLGIRVPMVIVSPYAKPGFTDSHRANYASLLAYAEHLYGLTPLATADTSAYGYAAAFRYTQPAAVLPLVFVRRGISDDEREYIRDHRPAELDPT